ncbi:hypothetical protein HPB51_007514 [Rhipicephalus microplus]|uniref:Uncharacterized protein n=1 Tax=Rhipicephalus microplus TaxID=6941 RepID=A0A9J6E808_RHIMP|nr:hypothetical protein HPB51_007514 [Rhipicephalus microplus]
MAWLVWASGKASSIRSSPNKLLMFFSQTSHPTDNTYQKDASTEDTEPFNSPFNVLKLEYALQHANTRGAPRADERPPVATYLTPPGHSWRGVIRGVDIDFTDADLQIVLKTPRNSTVLGPRRIKNTTTVVILFNVLKVQNYVYCGPIMYFCTLYKRQIDTSRNCSQVGHRQDVCPSSTDKVCHECGHCPPGPDDVRSALKCALC